jgi:hypothetical protein
VAPRLLRLTMDGLLTGTFGERPRASRIVRVPRLELPAIKRANAKLAPQRLPAISLTTDLL